MLIGICKVGEQDYGGAPKSDSSRAKGFFWPKSLERNQRRSETISIDVESDLQDYAGAIKGVSIPRADFLGKQSELRACLVHKFELRFLSSV